SEGKNHDSAIGGVPKSLPALIRARMLQMKATKAGFDWEKIEDVFGKLDEEVGELKKALKDGKKAEIEDELGDIFFVLVRISNFLDINPEDSLRKTIRKFTGRFEHIETEAARQGRRINDMTLAEMDVLWERAKKELI
ncbi:MAG: nucleoside triphosphate pyrophosphohydrolase, partial [Thermodesulfovibrionia bacterium]|nr:nucleoside triphosphate pyrophosphohydrolase [Thermodesulfovibrionia bacterium]